MENEEKHSSILHLSKYSELLRLVDLVTRVQIIFQLGVNFSQQFHLS